MLSRKAQPQNQANFSMRQEGVSEFVYYSPNAGSVSIAGTFNHWSINSSKLIKDPAGNWRISLRLTPGRYQYRFYVDGKWADDPKARETVLNSFGSRNAVLEVR